MKLISERSQSQSGRGVVLTSMFSSTPNYITVSIPVRPGGSPDVDDERLLDKDVESLNPSPAGG